MTQSLRKSPVALAIKRGIQACDAWLVAAGRLVGVRRRPAVLFEVFNQFGFDAQEPVVHCLADRGLVDVHVSGAVEGGLSARRIAALHRAGVDVHALHAARHRRFDAVVITDGRQVNSWRSSRYAFLHHGSAFWSLPAPYAFDVLESGDADFLLALHPAEVLAAQARFGERIRGRIRVVGQPKLDRLVNTTERSRALLESVGLDPTRRTIIYLSHWTPTSLMRSWGEEILAGLRTRTEFNVLVTGHHHLWNRAPMVADVDWRARLAWIAGEPHMRLLPQPEDLIELMTAADVAITDHTSATMEYALLNRPIAMFRHPEYQFSEPGIDELLRRSTHVFSRREEFGPAFAQALRSEGVDRALRAELLDHCFCHLGESGLRAAAAIEEIATSGALAES